MAAVGFQQGSCIHVQKLPSRELTYVLQHLLHIFRVMG